MWTEEEVLTGVCLSEMMHKRRDEVPGLSALWSRSGAWGMRQVAVDLIKPIEALWADLTEGFMEPVAFDDFVDMALWVVDWSSGPVLLPNARDLIRRKLALL